MHLQAYIGVHMSAWSYNNLIQAWEPILEPWNVILKADMNTGSLVRSDFSCLQDPSCHTAHTKATPTHDMRRQHRPQIHPL